MNVKNKGWDFLNSDDINSISDSSKGDWCYTNSDGNSSFYSSDGSWGYKNADGSSSFYDSDGSWGYRDEKGNTSYYGSDGSWGYKNSDGNGSFYGGSNGSTSDDDDDDDDDDGDIYSARRQDPTSTIIDNIWAAGAAINALEEAKKRERARINREKRHAWRAKHRTGIVVLVLLSIIALALLVGYYEYQKMIPMGFSSESLEGLKYTEAVQKLKESGFSNVYAKEISDLTISRDNEEELVSEVQLVFGDSFDADTKYPSNLRITVVYHTVELYRPPLTSKDAKGMNYSDVIKEFEDIGFINVTTEVEYDILTGWFTDDGEVKTVTINEEKNYDYYDEYRLDAEVVITYHAMKNNQ